MLNDDLDKLRKGLLEERKKLHQLTLQKQNTSPFTIHPIMFVFAFLLGVAITALMNIVQY